LAVLLLVAAVVPGSAVLAQDGEPPGGGDAQGAAPTFKAPPEGRLVPRQVIVKFEEDAGPAVRSNALRQEGVRKEQDLDLIGADVVGVPEGQSAEEVAADLQDRPDVEYAVPDQPLYRFDYGAEPRFGELWGLHNVGQEAQGDLPGGPGVRDVDINALQASGVTKGDEDLTVAVIDDGVDFSHPDLDGQQWVNPGESGAGKETNGRDDDGNGLVDDVNGWDYVGDDNTVHDEFDDFHGTHVAGTIAAAEDGEGIVGVAPNVNIMALKFLGQMGGETSDAVLAIEYAKENGAEIINASWGCFACPEEFVAPLETAIERSGLLFVAAAGNEGNDNDGPVKAYPAAFDSPNILSVAAVDNTGQPAFFTNFGAKSVDVSAPGVNVLSSVPGTPTLPAATLSTVEPTVMQTEESNAGLPPGKALVSGFGLEEIRKLEDQEAFMAKALEAVGRADEPVVLVDDDMSDVDWGEFGAPPDVRVNFKNAIFEATGQRPEIINVANGDGPTFQQLEGKTVVWATGWAFASEVPTFEEPPLEEPPPGEEPPPFEEPDFVPNLTPADQRELAIFLEGGGKLIIAGMDAMTLIEESTFATDTLGLAVRSNVFTLDFAGTPGTAFDGAKYGLDGFLSFPPAHDGLSPAEGSDTAQQGVYPGGPDTWEGWSGTSMAAPHVAGVAALTVSAKPYLLNRPLALKAEILKRTKPLPATEGLTVTGGMPNAMAAVRPDSTAPRVTRVSPANGSRKVRPGTNVEVVFSETMDAKTLNGATFKLVRRGATDPIGAEVRYNGTAQKAVLNPKRNLVPGATYTATVTRGAKDLAGNRLASKRSWSFKVR
jgi:subtilisin family serine protease